jgi:hypothetical protein
MRRVREALGARLADDVIGILAAHGGVRGRFERLTRHRRRGAARDLADHQRGAPLRPVARAGVLRDLLMSVALDSDGGSLERLTGRALAYAEIAAGAVEPVRDGAGDRSESDLFHDREIEWMKALDAAVTARLLAGHGGHPVAAGPGRSAGNPPFLI